MMVSKYTFSHTYMYLHKTLLGECMVLWGEHEQSQAYDKLCGQYFELGALLALAGVWEFTYTQSRKYYPI